MCPRHCKDGSVCSRFKSSTTLHFAIPISPGLTSETLFYVIKVSELNLSKNMFMVSCVDWKQHDLDGEEQYFLWRLHMVIYMVYMVHMVIDFWTMSILLFMSVLLTIKSTQEALL